MAAYLYVILTTYHYLYCAIHCRTHRFAIIVRPVLRRVKAVLAVLVFVGLLWYCGVIERLLAIDYDKFDWPPFIDVNRQVRFMVAHKPAEYVYENDWSRNRPITLPAAPLQLTACDTNNSSEVLLRIFVKSAVDHFDLRRAIRLSWGRQWTLDLSSRTEFAHLSNPVKIRTTFVLGLSGTRDLDAKAHAESGEFHDMLIVDMTDSYRNNTRKLFSSLHWLHLDRSCSDFDYILLVDDDYHVSIKNLLKLVAQQVANKSNAPHLYTGYRFDTAPFRMHFHKHYVNLKDYPFSRYPPYITAGAMLMSHATARHIYLASLFVRYYPYDDIYVAICAKFAQIQPTHNSRFVFWPMAFDQDRFVQVIAAHGFSDPPELQRIFHTMDCKPEDSTNWLVC